MNSELNSQDDLMDMEFDPSTSFFNNNKKKVDIPNYISNITMTNKNNKSNDNTLKPFLLSSNKSKSNNNILNYAKETSLKKFNGKVLKFLFKY